MLVIQFVKQGNEETICEPPLHVAPHTSHVKVTLSAPGALSRRFPQSVQNSNEPIADMVISIVVLGLRCYLNAR